MCLWGNFPDSRCTANHLFSIHFKLIFPVNYDQYTLEELVADPSFRSWVHKTNPQAITFWEQWRIRHPEKEPLVQEAVRLVALFSFSGRSFSPEEISTSWQALEARLTQPRTIDSKTVPLRPDRRMYISRVAATITLLLVAGWVLWVFFQQIPITHQTGYGETASITLPDGSEVLLNANSRLSYARRWEASADRKVSLEGEAFFHVQKVQDSQARAVKFQVQTEHLRVEVLGTQFNVNDRQGLSKVVLTSGKVQVSHPDAAAEPILMEPGEMVIYSPEQNQLRKQTVNTQVYTAWLQQKLVFDNTPLQEVVAILENNYGLQVEIRDQQLLNRTLTGEIEVRRVEDLLNALSRIYNLKISRVSNTVTIEQNS
jgi:transmembrane sensor